MSQKQLVKSCEKRNQFFEVYLQQGLAHGIWTPINILSVFDNKVLTGYNRPPLLLIYDQDGHYQSQVPLNRTNSLNDAVWTPQGYILYASDSFVTITSASGSSTIKRIPMLFPQYLSVSNQTICLIDQQTKVYQSTDGAFSWSLIFKSVKGWHCMQVIKIASSADYWTVEEKNKIYRLLVYSVNGKRSDNNVTWAHIIPATENGKDVVLSKTSSLSYDGMMSMFLNDNDSNVHILRVNGQYHCQLQSPELYQHTYKIFVEGRSQLLYLGKDNNEIQVFNLTYENDFN